jgi:hypothetical protein
VEVRLLVLDVETSTLGLTASSEQTPQLRCTCSPQLPPFIFTHACLRVDMLGQSKQFVVGEGSCVIVVSSEIEALKDFVFEGLFFEVLPGNVLKSCVIAFLSYFSAE